MTRIKPTAVHAALDQAASRITEAAGDDAKVSKAELKAAVAELTGTEKKLVDVFAGFATKRAGSPAGGLSERDVADAVAYAKVSMISKYDLDGDGLSPDEVKKMSKTGQLAVQFAEELGLSDVEAGPLTAGGESWYELRERMTIGSRVTLTDPAGIDLTLKQQIIAATHQSTYTHVKTLADAFEAVDMGEFAITEFTDPASGKAYVGIDYGAGDSTYGAIFEAGSDTVAFAIQDGGVEEPVAAPPASKEPMAPGESWYLLKGRSEIVTTETITDVKGLEYLFGQQLVSAAKQAGFKVNTPEEALAAVDAGGFTVTRFNDPAKRDQYLGIDFGAGDSTYGAIFRTYSSDAVFGIHDGEVAEPRAASGLNLSDDWYDLKDRSEILGTETITDVSNLDALLAEQLVAATHQSTYTHVNSPAEALEAVDDGGFLVTRFKDAETGKNFIGIDYGAGDNTYGAIFEEGSKQPLFGINDGELAAPRKPRGQPITTGGETYGAVLERVELLSQSSVTKPSEIVDAIQGEQLLAAAAFALPGAPKSLEEVFRAIDRGGFEVREIHDPATDTAYVAVDFSVGDGNVFGAIFEPGTTQVAIAIIDGLMEE